MNIVTPEQMQKLIDENPCKDPELDIISRLVNALQPLANWNLYNFEKSTDVIAVRGTRSRITVQDVLNAKAIMKLVNGKDEPITCKCDHCNEIKLCHLLQHPFAAEGIIEDDELTWWCDSCYKEAAADI